MRSIQPLVRLSHSHIDPNWLSAVERREGPRFENSMNRQQTIFSAQPERSQQGGFSSSMLLTARVRFRFCEHRVEVAKNGIAHRLLQTRADARRGGSELVEDPAEDHEGYLPVVCSFGARKRRSLAPEAHHDEVDENLPKSMLVFPGGS
jgi:hypothetical protein